MGYQLAVPGTQPSIVNSISQPVEHPRLLSSVDFSSYKFTSLGFTGKWLALIGDPVKGFIVMIFGKPKLGKSYLAVDFAGYLARQFGRVLYVSKEEGMSATMQQKLVDKKAAHSNLYLAEDVPEDLTPYDFVFFDSATRLGLEPEDISEFKARYPGKSFIYVFQTVKDGNFRGSQEFEHDVDCIIEVYERGKARQFGRFNQGGEMNIFEKDIEIQYKQAA